MKISQGFHTAVAQAVNDLRTKESAGGIIRAVRDKLAEAVPPKTADSAEKKTNDNTSAMTRLPSWIASFLERR